MISPMDTRMAAAPCVERFEEIRIGLDARVAIMEHLIPCRT